MLSFTIIVQFANLKFKIASTTATKCCHISCTFGRNALGLRSKHCLIARCLDSSCAKLLKQLLQLQLLQNSPLAKHSQYNFKHWDLVQLHGLRGLTPVDSNMSAAAGVFSATTFDASIPVGVIGNGNAGSILVIGCNGGIVTWNCKKKTLHM